MNELNKRFVIEKDNIIVQAENRLKETVKNLKSQFDKEKLELITDNLTKVAAIQELCDKKVKFIEAQLAAISQNCANTVEMLNNKLEKRSQEIENLQHLNKTLELEIFHAKHLLEYLHTEKEKLSKYFEANTKQTQEK